MGVIFPFLFAPATYEPRAFPSASLSITAAWSFTT